MKTSFLSRCVQTGAVALLVVLGASHGSAEPIVALTKFSEFIEFIEFDSTNPGLTSAPILVTGLAVGDNIVGIDARPLNGSIYAFARNGSVGNLYTIDRSNGVAKFKTTINTSLSGPSYGVDFNPVADRLRVVGDNGQNLRINVDSGVTIVDGALAFQVGDANAGVAPIAVASAYTNNVAGASATTLYNFELNTQSLVTQVPANNGTLQTIAPLGQAIVSTTDATFDISGSTGNAYAVLNGFELNRVNLASGEFTFLGNIGSQNPIFTITTVPEPSSLAVLGVLVSSLVMRRRRAIVC